MGVVLRGLQRGDTVSVRRTDGSTAIFTITDVRRYHKTAFPTQLVYGPRPAPVLRLITCTGEFDAATGHYADNLVVFARLAPDLHPDQATDLAAGRA